ncbi:unnamed protein product [Orchesella dallaii]|uniref:DET1 n=1 Tax=Orchesella dallaii TaxID=48710 RepID=A0ABP1REE8_9HEXA
MDFPRYVDNPVILQGEGLGGAKSKGLRIPRLQSQNIVTRLCGREVWGEYRRVGTEKYLQRSMYQSIYPNFTVTQVDKPPCFLRKFTPDGKHFIAFSSDQMSIEVYYFKGPQAANDLFVEKGAQWLEMIKKSEAAAKKGLGKKQQATLDEQRANLGFSDTYGRGFADHISSEDRDTMSHEIRRKMFETFFKLKFRISVAPQGEQLNRECSLFTEDYKYMIVGSATYIQEEHAQHVHYFDTYRNNESVDPNLRYPLEDYSIHLVDIQHGILSDTKTFKTDKIFLSHNQGMYLYNNKLAILSIQHQTIHIFHVENGQFWEVQTVGRFCHEDDELLFSQVHQFLTVRPKEEAFLNSLKHRLLTHVFKKAYTEAHDSEELDMSKLSRFYQYYEQLKKLRIWKMQLLDEDHLLLKYSSEDVVTLKCSEPNSQHCLFVFYNIPKTEVLAVYENTSECLVDLFEAFADNFRNNFLTADARYSSSPSNSIYSKQIHQKFRNTITSARFGGPTEATKRILAQLPISAQSFSASPYLDQALFSYDDHRVSAMERPKACGENPIRFYGRDSMVYKFQLHAGILSKGSSPSGRRLVAFTFHPSAPFAISVQRAANTEYLAHFHLRLDPFSVMPL